MDRRYPPAGSKTRRPRMPRLPDPRNRRVDPTQIQWRPRYSPPERHSRDQSGLVPLQRSSSRHHCPFLPPGNRCIRDRPGDNPLTSASLRFTQIRCRAGRIHRIPPAPAHHNTHAMPCNRNPATHASGTGRSPGRRSRNNSRDTTGRSRMPVHHDPPGRQQHPGKQPP